MKRASLVYILMTVIFFAGLWAILKAGRGLSAPVDLAGRWQLEALEDIVPAGPLGEVVELDIGQSGRFFAIGFNEILRLDLRLVDQTRMPEADPPAVRMVMEREPWQFSAEGVAGGDLFIFRLDGPKNGAWTARRTVRTFPPAARSPAPTPHPPAPPHVRD